MPAGAAPLSSAAPAAVPCSVPPRPLPAKPAPPLAHAMHPPDLSRMATHRDASLPSRGMKAARWIRPCDGGGVA